MSVISYPIPPYQNLPIEPQNYQPRAFVISAITLGISTLVTTVNNMNYVVGQLVRLIIPETYGCRELNGKEGYVVGIPAANQVQVSINSSMNVNAYIASSQPTPAQILAIGDVNTGYTSSTGASVPLVAIPGSFINIS